NGPMPKMRPTFSWPMIRGGALVLYEAQSLPQTPAASIFSTPPSGGISGNAYSRTSVVPGPVVVAAKTVWGMTASFYGFRERENKKHKSEGRKRLPCFLWLAALICAEMSRAPQKN